MKTVEEKIFENFKSFRGKRSDYAVPGLWIGKRGILSLDPCKFFHNALRNLSRSKRVQIRQESADCWTRKAVIYNMFVRSTCAFDHNSDGKLDLPVNSEGWRESGTFLKAIAMLPYIRSLGVNTIHLLPITSIGSDGNKGTLGSPYAIKNPYELDSSLSEPNAHLGVEEEFRAFVRSAHHLGIRVVVEFVFRTASKDGDWIKEHPEWFYWIKETVADRKPGSSEESEYGSPIFEKEELEAILAAVKKEDFENLLPPHKIYRDMFTAPPRSSSVSLVNGRYIGVTDEGDRVRIPGAFADWPPHDTQPPWGDVTYLKMYEHPEFNYIAYNTLRMYDKKLARSENINRPLWEKIAEIIPHYQHSFQIDGVMIDMGHALPMELKQEMIRRARQIDPDFVFWDENFSVDEKSVKEGYNAVIGYQWSDQHKPDKFRNLLKRFAHEGYALPFFATPESHNTPRAAARPGGIKYCAYAWMLSNFIPAIPFIHSGFELGEKYPINTGLDFTKEELLKLPSEKLPLFSEYGYDWARKDQIVELVRRVSALRSRYVDLVTDPSSDSFQMLDSVNPDLIAFMRSRKKKPKLIVAANSNMERTISFSLPAGTKKEKLKDLISGKVFSVRKGVITGKLKAGGVAVFTV